MANWRSLAILLIVGMIAACNAVPAPSVSSSPAIETAVPEGQPSSIVSFTFSAPPSAPAPSPTPSAAIPTSLQPSGVTFISTLDGWLIGTGACPTGACTQVMRTRDGGRTWESAPAPAAPVTGSALYPASGTVRSIRFADRLNGWAFGPSLWATHDGGSTWHKVSIRGLPVDPIMALETAAGSVTAVVVAGGLRLAISPIGRDAWQVTGPSVDPGAGPVPQSILVLAQHGGWFVQVNRTPVGGARLVSGAWRPWQPPCINGQGPTLLAAATSSALVAECDGGIWGPPISTIPVGNHVYLSNDGGQSFAHVDSRLPLDAIDSIAMTAQGTIAIAGSSAVAAAIAVSWDGGRSWRLTFRGGSAEQILYVGFTTATQGVAIASGEQGGAILMTRDGGRSWQESAF
jgi:photosystem II stability/assembly factor-like uncharacterized protein